jgi:glycosyltransferase involved in cell wall biosynthesis
VGSTFVVPGWSPQRVLAFLQAYAEALFRPRAGAVIVIQRVYTFGLYALALRLLTFFRGERCIYDIDDAEYMERRAGTIHAFMRSCALVTAGSEGLLAYARRYNPNGRLLTSPVPDHGCRKAPALDRVQRNAVFTIGWIGCFWGTHERNLHTLLVPALRDLGIRAKLVVLGARNDEAEARLRACFTGDPWLTIEVDRAVDWCDEAAVHARIARFDVGVAPLLDTEINRCKSAFKLKQYMSCGVPVLASPIGENARFLEHGVNGLACRSAHAFRQGIYRMAGIPDAEYARFSARALDTVPAFDLEGHARTFLDACAGLKPFRSATRSGPKGLRKGELHAPEGSV